MGGLQVRGQLGLHGENEASLGYIDLFAAAPNPPNPPPAPPPLPSLVFKCALP